MRNAFVCGFAALCLAAIAPAAAADFPDVSSLRALRDAGVVKQRFDYSCRTGLFCCHDHFVHFCCSWRYSCYGFVRPCGQLRGPLQR